MTSRERFKIVLSKKIPDRIPMVELVFWPETIERWRREGLPANIGPHEYFGLDKMFCQCPFDTSLRLPSRVLEDNEEYKIVVDSDGVTMKSWQTHYAPPQEVDFTIKTEKDWKKVKDNFSDIEGRFSEQALPNWQQADAEAFRALNPREPVWYLLRTLGFETALMAMALEPDWIDDMMNTYTDFILKMMTKSLEKGFKYEAVWFFADLCYKNGMLFSPEVYRERFAPYHRKIKAFCKEHNMFLIIHCDGDVRQFIPLLIKTGFDCVQPLEARAGNDVRQLKNIYNTNICFFGNINMDVLAKGNRDAIEQEVISKVEAAKVGGGYIFHSDHSVPPGVSFESYRLAVDLARIHGNY